jgi:hypothetical protein
MFQDHVQVGEKVGDNVKKEESKEAKKKDAQN